MNRARFSALAVLLIAPLLFLQSPARTAERRVNREDTRARVEALRAQLLSQRDAIEFRYGYETIRGTIEAAAGDDAATLASVLRPLSTRIYTQWAESKREHAEELKRLEQSQRVLVEQGGALEEDIVWLEDAGRQILKELSTVESCLVGIVVHSLQMERHEKRAKAARREEKRRRAALARLPGTTSEDPLAEWVERIEFEELNIAAARATRLVLEDELQSMNSRAWMPVIPAESKRRAAVVRDLSVPPSIVSHEPSPWPSGARTGANFGAAIHTMAFHRAAEETGLAAPLDALEALVDQSDLADKGVVSELKIRALAVLRASRAHLAGQDRLPEVRSVTMLANGKPVFTASRPARDDVENVSQRILDASRSMDDVLQAALLMRRQFAFHGLAAERGREGQTEDLTTGDPVDLRSPIRALFTASRAARALDGPARQRLEGIYAGDSGVLDRPRRLRRTLHEFLTGGLRAPDGGPDEPPLSASSLRAVADKLAELSEGRARLAQRHVKRTLKRWKRPTPGFPDDSRAAREILTDELIAWVQLPAALWAQARLRGFTSELAEDIARLEELVGEHRASDGFRIRGDGAVRDGMKVEVLIALDRPHEGALSVTLGRDTLDGEGLYMSATPGLLFRTQRLDMRLDDDADDLTLELLLP